MTFSIKQLLSVSFTKDKNTILNFQSQRTITMIITTPQIPQCRAGLMSREARGKSSARAPTPLLWEPLNSMTHKFA